MGKERAKARKAAVSVVMLLLMTMAILLPVKPAAGGIPGTSEGWSYPVRINEPGMADPPNASQSNMAIDSLGKVHVAYREKDAGIHYSTNKSGAWTDIKVSDTDEETWYPSIAVDKNDKIYIVYNANDLIRFVTDKSGTWSDPVTITEEGGTPYLAIDTNGKMHMVLGFGNSSAYYLNNVLGPWTDLIKISAKDSVGRCKLALDSKNKAHVLYGKFGYGGDLRYVTNKSGSWSAPLTLSKGTDIRFDMLVGSDDRVHVASRDDGLGRYRVNESGSWSDPVAVTGTISPSGISIAIDASGGPHCIFNDGWSDYYAQETPAGWLNPVTIPGYGEELEFLIDTGNMPHIISEQNYEIHYMTEAGPNSTWYLAEGSTDWGFDCYVSIINPNDEAVNVALTYMTSDGPEEGPIVAMPAFSQATVYPKEDLGEADFSTKVQCEENLPISVDRTMYWTGPTSTVPEAHCATGATFPEATWYMPEGSSNWGFECFLLIQNPNGADTEATVTWMIEGASPQTTKVNIPSSSRMTLNMLDFIGAADASIKVESERPVICERAMYRYDRREGHDSGGTPTAAADYYLAEGCSGFGFTTYILVQNPNDSEAQVTVTYQATAGEVQGPSFTMPANSRKTICVNDTTAIPGPDPSFSTHVHGSKPIIAERAMYWNGGDDNAQVCHDSIGLDSPHTSWYLADGQTSEGRETWTLVQNPNSEDVTVQITYLTPDGTGNVVKTETIAGGSRKSFNMADHSGITGRAAIMVVSQTAGKKVMVERAMYWNNRGTGTDTVGGYAD